MDSIRVRPATPDEAAQLTDIALRSKAHWGYEDELLKLWANDLTVSPESCDGESVWVLEIEGIIAGFGEVLVDGDTAILDDLWIDPAHMSKGFGQRLFGHLREQAEHRGATRLTIESEPYAAGFYERMGARTIGEVRSESVPGRALPLLEIDLSSLENTTISTE